MISKANMYDKISSFYDDMINASSLTNKINSFKSFLDDNIKYAADYGCGSGNDSIALALKGLNVTGFDPSINMIKIAKAKTKLYNLKIRFHNTGFEIKQKKYKSYFDLAVCLGNTIPNANPNILKKGLKNIYYSLKPSGLLIIQLVNYNKILKNNNRILKITDSKKELFVRFYDFKKNKLNFNILIINKININEYELNTSEIFPYSFKFIKKLLLSSNFSKVEAYSDFHKNKFSIRNSDNLVLFARKNFSN